MATTNWRFSAIQLTSSPEPAVNLAAVRYYLQQLPVFAQHVVLLPECFAVFGGNDKLQLAHQAAIGEGAIQQACQQLAIEFGVYLVAGSQPTTTDNPARFAASSLVFGPDGKLLADYQKLHLFDVNVADSTGSYRESATTMPGNKISLCQLPDLKLGLSICYDVRFPGLMQALAAQGMQLLTVPSAFTRPTGAAHWHTLLKARAIENQCFVIAANQTGVHANGRETFGHSLIIDPWGEVLADAGTAPGWISALVDVSQSQRLSEKMPVHQHNRFNSELK
ncbi:carbon-nitrogen hydrolase family protein [Arsukibacterium sp. MJ3]|uniref:carbon-nitrogen hydrolase family protein n=1 Tax=Arsukibacterium sp. MJ3 TaxID=1632859 RepID=UPI000ABD9923|nr:carbon-nitrogen hydrolase family protein [Arsukibacterium sp. MJ3]